MTWSDAVLEQIECVDLRSTDESDFYGPLNTILYECFPPDEHYQIAPQFIRLPGPLDFTIRYIVRKGRNVVFFLEIKSYSKLQNCLARQQADSQMRHGFRELLDASMPMSQLYGISIFGFTFCVFKCDTGTRRLTPPSILPDPEFLNDTAPMTRWESDLKTAEGEAKFKEVITEVKKMTLGL